MDEEFTREYDGVDQMIDTEPTNHRWKNPKMLKTIWPSTIWLRTVKLALALSCTAILLAPFAARGQQANKQSPPPEKKPVDYNRFTHETHLGVIKVPNTNFARELKCATCHERPSQREISNNIVATTDRNKQLSLKFPGHKACVECHVVQFTSKPQQTCVICHDTGQGLNARPPQRDFPLRKDFNAFFDAKQHELHVTYKLSDGKQLDCAYCHKPTQKTLAVTIGSHPECYECHAPGSFDDKAKAKSDCVVCHTQSMFTTKPEPYAAKLESRAYGAKFSHVEHVKFMDCRVCHSIQGGYNQYSPSSPAVKQHNTDAQRGGRGCFSCHDGKQHYGRTVFSGDDAQVCVKCHNVTGNIKVFKVRG
jgi:predicted CXXCH cytochrome family protein